MNRLFFIFFLSLVLFIQIDLAIPSCGDYDECIIQDKLNVYFDGDINVKIVDNLDAISLYLERVNIEKINRSIKLKNNNKIEYDDLNDDISLDYDVAPKKVKERIIISKKPKDDVIFVYSYSLSEDLSFYPNNRETSEIYVLSDKSVKGKFAMPFINDSNGKIYGLSYYVNSSHLWINVSYDISQNLNYPIVIDPTYDDFEDGVVNGSKWNFTKVENGASVCEESELSGYYRSTCSSSGASVSDGIAWQTSSQNFYNTTLNIINLTIEYGGDCSVNSPASGSCSCSMSIRLCNESNPLTVDGSVTSVIINSDSASCTAGGGSVDRAISLMNYSVIFDYNGRNATVYNGSSQGYFKSINLSSLNNKWHVCTRGAEAHNTNGNTALFNNNIYRVWYLANDVTNATSNIYSNSSNIKKNDVINVTLNVSDETGLSHCWFHSTLNGTNSTPIKLNGLSGKCDYITSINLTRGKGINISGYVNDTSGNLNFSVFSWNVNNSAPSLTANQTFNCVYLNNCTIQINVTDIDNDTITWVNFTIHDPRGNATINNTNATSQYLNVYNSTKTLIFIEGFWNITINASDNQNFYNVISWKIFVNDSAPNITSTAISPSPADVINDLNCSIVFNDFENNAGTYYYLWFINGTETSYKNVSLNASLIQLNANLTCQGRVDDTSKNSSWLNSSILTIGDTIPPKLYNMSLSANSGYSDTSFNIFSSCYDENNLASNFPKVEVLDPNNDKNNYTMGILSGVTFSKSLTPSIVGTYNFTFYCIDGSNNMNQSISNLNFISSLRPSPTTETGGGGGGTIVVESIRCESSGYNYTVANSAGRFTGYSLLFDRKTTKPKCRDILLTNYGIKNVTIHLSCLDTGNYTQGFCKYVNLLENEINLPANQLVESTSTYCINPFEENIEGDKFFFSIGATDTAKACTGQLPNEVIISNFLSKFTSWRAIDFTKLSEGGQKLNYPTILFPIIITMIVWALLIFLFSKLKIGVVSVLIESILSLAIFSLITYLV